MTSHAVTPHSSVQLVHIGAVSHILNHSAYAIRGKVSFAFRDESGNLRAIRLDSLHLPASPDASANSIDVILHGRWQAACAAVRRDNILQIECACVEAARDPEVNSVQVKLEDPISSTQSATPPKVSVLSSDMHPISSISYHGLSEGMIRAVVPQVSPVRRIRSPRVSIGDSTRHYSYTSIAQLWDLTQGSYTAPSRGEKINFYGIVIDCRAPCTTRGPDLRCELVVADESSLLTGELRTMVIFRFERDPTDCVPFRSMGDVIRAHRIHVGRYNDPNTGTSTIQGVGRFYSTFLIWSHEGTDFLPVACTDPVQISDADGSASGNVTHIVTAQDREKISSLRNWAKNYLFQAHRVHRPYMRTVLEVIQAPPTANFLSRSFDLLCCVEGSGPLRVVDGNLKFIVTDGLFDPQHGGRRMRVESENSMDQLEHEPTSQFIDFCPSWEKKPCVPSSWLLIRDINIRMEGSDRVAVLSVSRKTSTMVWHPANSPEVRMIKEKFRHAAQVNRSCGHDANQRAMRELESREVVRRVFCESEGNASATSHRRYASQANGAHFDTGLPIPTRTICKHSHMRARISTIADIRQAIAEKRFEPHRLKARARSCSVPRDLRLLCRPWCGSCKKFMKIDRDHRLLECLWCARTLRTNQHGELEWAYCMCLNLEDASGRRVDAWIEGDEGSVFFQGSPPGNLVHSIEKRRELLKRIENLLSPECEMDCCVFPYEYQDEFGLYHISCKIFATQLPEEASQVPAR